MPRSSKPFLISFYCNKGGVGKTTALHNIAYLLATDMHLKVLVVDADPQCNLSNQLLKTPARDEVPELPPDREDLVEGFYREETEGDGQRHIYDCFKMLVNIQFMRDVSFMDRAKHVSLKRTAYENLYLLPGHIRFSEVAPYPEIAYINRGVNPQAIQILGGLTNYIRRIAEHQGFDIVLIDLNPGISMLNAAFILGSDYFTIPSFPDSYTAQGLGNLSEKLPEWVDGLRFAREDITEEAFKMPEPAKFLGYFALRYPSRRQRGTAPDVVQAYLKWWNKIHEIMETKFVKNIKLHGLITEHFHLQRHGVKDFASAGERVQEEGFPICDYSKYQSAQDRTIKRHFNMEFKNLISDLLSNMEHESLSALGFSDVKTFFLTSRMFGGIKGRHQYRQVNADFQGEEVSFNLYSELSVDPDRHNFLRLPIPFEEKQLEKFLIGNLTEAPILEYIASEIREYILRMRTAELSPSFRNAARFPHFYDTLGALKQSYEQAYNRIRESRQIEARFGATQLPGDFFSLKEYVKKFSDGGAQNILRGIEGIERRIKQSKEYKQFVEASKNRGLCQTYITECFSSAGPNRFCFQLQERHSFQAEYVNMLHAILLSLPDKFRLVIWESDNQELETLKIVFQGGPQAETIPFVHVFYDRDANMFRPMIATSDLTLGLRPMEGISQSDGIDNHWYSDDEMNRLLTHFLQDHQDVMHLDCMLGNNLARGNDLTVNLNQFNEQRNQLLSRGEGVRDRVLVPINLSQSHWALLYIIYRHDHAELPAIYYFDPLGNELPEEVNNAILGVRQFGRLTITNIGSRVQDDNYNCGAWVIEAAKAITEGGAIPGRDFDIHAARMEHMQILREQTPSQPESASGPAVAGSQSGPRRRRAAEIEELAPQRSSRRRRVGLFSPPLEIVPVPEEASSQPGPSSRL